MNKSKKYYYDRIVLGLQDGYPNGDWKIQPREVYRVVDDIVNSMAKTNFIENWKSYGSVTDEQFITEWSGDSAISVVDVDNRPSYIILPANYVALPANAGIDEIWPENYSYGSVRIQRHDHIRKTRHLMSGNLQHELGGYPTGDRFIFNQVAVGKNYALKFGVRLVIKDSSQISETAPYPIPGDLEQDVIDQAIQFFTRKRLSPTDTIRDSNDAINRN